MEYIEHLRQRYVSLSDTDFSLADTAALTRVSKIHKKMSRLGSPLLRLGSNLARMNPMASRDLLKPLPALREPIFGPKSLKTSTYGQAPRDEASPGYCSGDFPSFHAAAFDCRMQMPLGK